MRLVECRRGFVSLYSGAGGLDAGFIEAGFEPVWANDFDPVAVETYNENIPGKHAHAGDIDSVCASLPSADEVELVIGGPPCQGFSVAGHMRADDPRSQHVWRFLEIVEELRPRAFVMENVAALAVNKRWSGLIEALKSKAESLGYTVEILVLDASHYGVPQARRRMFLVGVLKARPQKPRAISAKSPPTVGEALAELPDFGLPGNDTKCTARITPALRPVLRRSPFAGMPFNGKGRALNLEAPAPTLPASMGGNRTPIVDQWQLEGRAKESWIVGYHARLMDGRKPLKRVPKRMRRLTVEEAAAIQTFKPSWRFKGSQSAQFRQIGNAVPPRLAFHVAIAVEAAMSRSLQTEAEEAPDQSFALVA